MSGRHLRYEFLGLYILNMGYIAQVNRIFRDSVFAG